MTPRVLRHACCRFLDFVEALLTKLVDNPEMELNECASKAYEEQLAARHGFLVRNAIYVRFAHGVSAPFRSPRCNPFAFQCCTCEFRGVRRVPRGLSLVVVAPMLFACCALLLCCVARGSS